jgi:undecaprenyl-phosphate 4-deoxy-4-formamido-L-arabinose transferase
MKKVHSRKIVLSIIVPVYNSQNILPKLINSIFLLFKNKKIIFEIFLVNDFSQDNSWEVIKNLSSKYKFVKGINLSQNFGQHNAIMAALNQCNGKNIITIDDDLQHSPDNIIDIYQELLKGFDVCYVNYLERKHEKWKIFFSYTSNIISSFLLNKPLKIYCSSYKGFNINVLKKIIKYKKSNVYIDGLILNFTRNISMISVPHYPRLEGKSNYNFSKLFGLWCNMTENFPTKPFRLATFVGFFLKLIIILFKKKSKHKKQYVIVNKTYK